MKDLKRVLAMAIASIMCLSLAACTSASTVVGSIDGRDIPAGVYVMMQSRAYSNATAHEDYDSTLDPLDNTIEDQDLEDWVNEQAMQELLEFIAIEKEFEDQGLELTEDEQSEIDAAVEENWDYYGESYEEIGVSRNSYQLILENSYKYSNLFLHYYGEDGLDEVSSDKLIAHFKQAFAQFRYISFSKPTSSTDEDAEDTTEEDTAAMKELAESYLERAEEGEDFDLLIKEYSDILAAESDSDGDTAGDDTSSADESSADENSGEDTSGDEDGNDDDTASELTDAQRIANLNIIKGDDTAYNYNNYYYSDSLQTAIFEDAKIGTPILLEDDYGFYVVLRNDVTDYEETYDEMRENILYDLMSDDFDDIIAEKADALDNDVSESSVKRYKVKKIIG